MKRVKKFLKQKLAPLAWDLFCTFSVLGIWPRFIEPRLLERSRLSLRFPSKKSLSPCKILHFSDLHFGPQLNKTILKKALECKQAFDPDLVLFTGDFFCRENIYDPEVLVDFFSQMRGKVGSYCAFGNHDYTPYVTISEGKIDSSKSASHPIVKGFKHLISPARAYRSPPLIEGLNPKPSSKILSLLEKTPFTLLHNERISIDSLGIDLVGLADYWSGNFTPSEELLHSTDNLLLVLSHNPDSFVDLKPFPIDLILSGHTHGRQVNLPFFGPRLGPVLNKNWARGLYQEGSKYLYVNRGLGGQLPFRWFSKPECTQITLG